MSKEESPIPEEVVARYYRRVEFARKFALLPGMVMATASDELSIAQSYAEENLESLIKLSKSGEKP
ncbi:MAG: hypothetical protein WD887_01020 [Candidatus Saccharimonadales bacterium]